MMLYNEVVRHVVKKHGQLEIEDVQALVLFPRLRDVPCKLVNEFTEKTVPLREVAKTAEKLVNCEIWLDPDTTTQMTKWVEDIDDRLRRMEESQKRVAKAREELRNL